MDELYGIKQKVTPDPTPDGPSGDSWIQKNLVLVIVMGVVLVAIIVIIIYFCFCKQKKGYMNALYDDDKLMKARI
jgi:hypothetical protein